MAHGMRVLLSANGLGLSAAELSQTTYVLPTSVPEPATGGNAAVSLARAMRLQTREQELCGKFKPLENRFIPKHHAEYSFFSSLFYGRVLKT